MFHGRRLILWPHGLVVPPVVPIWQRCRHFAPCGLRGCENRPAPFPDWMVITTTMQLLSHDWRPASVSARLVSKGPSVQFSTETVSASDHVRVLGVTFSSDLSLDNHVASVCSSGFHWLCQLRRVRRSLDMDFTKMLVHAFIASRMDYCNAILAGSPRSMTDKLQRHERCSTSRHWYT